MFSATELIFAITLRNILHKVSTTDSFGKSLDSILQVYELPILPFYFEDGLEWEFLFPTVITLVPPSTKAP